MLELMQKAASHLNESQKLRGIMSWALMGAGVVCTAMAVGTVLIVWLGAWSPETQEQRLNIIGWSLLGSLFGMGLVIVSLAIGGPVGRWKAGIGLANFEAGGKSEGNGEDEDGQPAG